MKSWTPPTNEKIEQVLSSVKKETDRQYFFSRLNNPLWVGPLHERGFFTSPPGIKRLPDGYVQYPRWPELAYLVTVAAEVTNQVIDIVLALPKTDNPLVYEDIFSIAIKLEGRDSARLLPKLVECTELENQFLAHRYSEILRHWTAQGNLVEALEVVKKLVPFREDPRSRAKRKLRKKSPTDLESSLEPAPRFRQWEYQQILEKGVRPLTEKEPYQVARILIEATATMIRMSSHPEDLDERRDEDYSEIWCRRLDPQVRDHQDAKKILVHTLTYACEQVYIRAPESIADLDQELRNQHWKVFKRLRQHLYALHPSDLSLPWIREFILSHQDYSKWDHHYEFQRLIRRACEHFGPRLISEAEGTAIFDSILSGPSRNSFREWMGNQYSEENFGKRQRLFHLKQLRPFAPLLNREFQRYYDELETEFQDDPISDESYSPLGEGTSGWVTNRSPKSVEDLEALTDEELLAYVNNWDEQQHDKDNWLVEINIQALAGAFQALFTDKVIPDEGRLAYWLAHRDEIERPIYVATMVKSMLELAKQQHFDKLDRWIEFCAWTLSHPEIDHVDGQPEPNDESRERPNWGSSRRAVVDFIDACVSIEVNAPIAVRGGLANLLDAVCTQFDWRLDRDQALLLNRDDPVSEAINNTRSRSLESLLNFGFWVRRHLPDDPVPEMIEILGTRVGAGAKLPLTQPEYALLGMHFGDMCALNRDWAKEHRAFLFPQDREPVWRDAFESFIRFNRPLKQTFEILRPDFEFALQRLMSLNAASDSGEEFVDRLGQHLFTYYLWQVYPLTGDDSPLAQFYEKTDKARQHWANLFNHVGWSLSNSTQLAKEFTDRAIAFFDWRLDAAEPLELQEFTFWLEADCLDPEWRLRSYSKILDLGHGKNAGLSVELSALNKLLPAQLPLVVECFAKLTDAIEQGNELYVSADEAKPILKAGLNAADSQVRKNAERAREKLLRIGRFDFLDLE